MRFTQNTIVEGDDELKFCLFSITSLHGKKIFIIYNVY